MDVRNRDLAEMGGAGDMDPEKKGQHMSRDLAFIFNVMRDNFPAKPYAEDGNPDFYTEDNLKARAELKESPVVIEAI